MVGVCLSSLRALMQVYIVDGTDGTVGVQVSRSVDPRNLATSYPKSFPKKKLDCAEQIFWNVVVSVAEAPIDNDFTSPPPSPDFTSPLR